MPPNYLWSHEQIEQGAIILAYCRRHPAVPGNVTPKGYWQSWNADSKQVFRERVQAKRTTPKPG